MVRCYVFGQVEIQKKYIMVQQLLDFYFQVNGSMLIWLIYLDLVKG